MNSRAPFLVQHKAPFFPSIAFLPIRCMTLLHYPCTRVSELFFFFFNYYFEVFVFHVRKNEVNEEVPSAVDSPDEIPQTRA